ncbi:MAG: hypothetical protein LT106_07535 [Burkholderiaceae bacterium]|nr:hypothetical protein [Burkholderiaceae bacterium]
MNATTMEKRNVLLFAGAQALFQTVSVMVMTLSGLAGLHLARLERHGNRVVRTTMAAASPVPIATIGHQ